jgi:3-dehydroquinate synthase
MKTIKICASRDYDVIIGNNILPTLGKHIRALSKADKVCIVSDSNVYPLYAQAARSSLETEGLIVTEFVFPAGESSKNGCTYLSLLNFLAENNISRNDCIVALGGGVVGDLSGFAAATYLRGIDYVQVPTTLLAMVDSSVGGKTAIDLPAGKNLCGAFYQPAFVLCDTQTLSTLPEDIFRDGCAEIIKYAVLFDQALFAHLQENGIAFDRESVISRCVEMKRDVVAADEFDRGARMKLNLGHTVGHGIEAGSNFTVTHGKAVAIGMTIVARAASKNELCSVDTAEAIIRLLQVFGLPVNTNFTSIELADAAMHDKKRSGDTIHLIVPRAIGQCDILPIETLELKSFIEAGL